MKYSPQLQEEIKQIVTRFNIGCSPYDFEPKGLLKFFKKQEPSKTFMHKFEIYAPWSLISERAKLSGEFIETFQNYVDWFRIASHQKLSEEFIYKWRHKLDLESVFVHQNLSEKFIEKFPGSWLYAAKWQKLSEEFIEKHANKLSAMDVCKYQKLSEEFIEKIYSRFPHGGQFDLYQRLSEQFRIEHGISIPETNWLYATVETKEEYIRKNTSYEIQEDEGGKYILAYKGIRSYNYSYFTFRYKYEVGQEYESHCDCNLDVENSFGLSAWTLEMAEDYCNEKIILVKIYLKDIGAIVYGRSKIRCFKFKVMEEIK